MFNWFHKIKKKIQHLLLIPMDLRETLRKLRHLESGANTQKLDFYVDNKTPKLNCLHFDPSPVLSPGRYPWMLQAVFDARPIHFQGQDLLYFCAQPFYRSDSQLLLGRCTKVNGAWTPDASPVLYRDEETFGMGIPTLLVFKEKIYAVYFDATSTYRLDQGSSPKLIIASSNDGITFSKRFFSTPFGETIAKYRLTTFGLPWLLQDNGNVFLYTRGKISNKKNYIFRSRINLEDGEIEPPTVTELTATSINIAVHKKDDLYVLFYRQSMAGGIYAVPSADGISWETDKEVMLTDSEANLWGWDIHKICPVPFESPNSSLEVYYLGSCDHLKQVGRAKVNWEPLKQWFLSSSMKSSPTLSSSGALLNAIAIS